MADTRGEAQYRQLRTPRSAAVAGIVFGALFATSIVLLVTAMPSTAATPWVRGGSKITTALFLAPIAGIAFLWFVGVLRDQFGNLEDRFFSTVFLGSGLLFLAMTFVSMALAGALLAVSRHSSDVVETDIVFFGREVMLHINNVYSVRMAAVFMISLATMWLRTRLMPKPLVIGTYLLAVVLLVVVSFSFWVALVFPAWVLVVSAYILATEHRQPTSPG
ncbi:hypothetical protein AXA44_10630 [Rhodococcus sp. SC4]|uniref:hypothetical protein n=1 Tax=Rhodococcus sp. LB1 TaxID=1807499 RepID=UPI000769AA8B|nr:hypothetical protein [Rhodococcus sp. LB1]KXF52350.1 hypothetical protein AXA44_10630 [Rhodococcus sp. SC4]KXX55383.1 hypothetical protein AZG88_19300 [Rhodococcus sp. LB1]